MRASQPVESRVVGNYVLGEAIGRGGTSEVFAAEHRFLGDPVAVKLLRSSLAFDDTATQAFVDEAAQTRAIQHPNVVRVLDFGCDDDTRCCYLVMERIAGESLAARMKRGRLDEPEVRRLFAAIADGMQAAHAVGIVHRDLKPANVMLSGDVPKIVDFGIAKYLGNAAAVSTERRIGTPAYMAPEQLTGGLIAPCVDIWAFGVMVFEAVTGVPPFAGFEQGRCPQLFEAAPRAGKLAAISPALDLLVARCLDRDPGKRPRSMSEVALALRCEEPELERVTQDLDGAHMAEHGVPAVGASRSHTKWWIAAGVAAVVLGVLAASFVPDDEAAPSALASVTPTAPAIAQAPPNREQAPPKLEPAPPGEPVAAMPSPAPVSPTPASGSFEVEVRSVPVGARIVVDGKSRGVTPARLRLAKPTSILVRHAGYRAARVRAERTGPVEVRLVRVPKQQQPDRRDRRDPDDRETLD